MFHCNIGLFTYMLASHISKRRYINYHIIFSMLLELTDDHGQCVEVYETALSVLQKSADIATVWIR